MVKHLILAGLMLTAACAAPPPPAAEQEQQFSMYKPIRNDADTNVFTDPETGCEYLTFNRTPPSFEARMEYRDGLYVHKGCEQ